MNTGAVKLDVSHSNDLLERFAFDTAERSEHGIICGIDEAGRGPLAGDVYAAAVVLPEGLVIEDLNDSKKLSEKKRELLYDEIITKADAYCIATASAAEIDEINILNAALLAMRRAFDGLSVRSALALVDGNKAPELGVPVKTVVKGDSLSASIAAASILAKVARDRYMKDLDIKYPEYMFAKHKGYGTKLHYEMIAQHGLCPEHRRSFFKRHTV
ncbi:MAG: ribonuclease HII [Ruminiclostridium sp.]|nr:ribonuclease HII [Ruminiclostridium sp.]